MKSKELAARFNLNHDHFIGFILQSDYKYKKSYLGAINIADDENIDMILEDFAAYEQGRIAEEQRNILAVQEELARKEREEAKKRRALANMFITSGFNFDGYKIVKYSGYISGDDVINIDRGGGFSKAVNPGEALMQSLSEIRRKALMELKEAAYALECNAVIGVDFDYLIFSPETAGATGGTLYLPYVFGVTANGNAVVIEKIEG